MRKYHGDPVVIGYLKNQKFPKPGDKIEGLGTIVRETVGGDGYIVDMGNHFWMFVKKSELSLKGAQWHEDY